MEADADARAYDALSEHPRAADLGAIARSLMTTAAQVRRVESRPEHVAKLAEEMRLPHAEASTPFGNARSDLGAIARSLMTTAAQVRRVESRPEHVAKLAEEMRLPHAEASTPFGNA